MSTMFIEKHDYEYNNQSIPLLFLKSLNVQAYPCGRRRSDLIDKDANDNTKDDKYRIPFDPEARLNTEFNNRRHTGLNGFTQSFIEDWNTEKNTFSFILGGYTFSINLIDGTETTAETVQTFSTKIINGLGLDNQTDCTKIYANIRLEEIPLYEGIAKYRTWVLRDQSANRFASNVLDMLKNNAVANSSNVADYYFSGLSFSAAPIAPVTDTENRLASSDCFIEATDTSRAQHTFSLCILTKESGEWKLFEPAKLPRVNHGETEDSLEVGHLNAKSIQCNQHPVALFDINPVENGFYQLHLFNATEAQEV